MSGDPAIGVTTVVCASCGGHFLYGYRCSKCGPVNPDWNTAGGSADANALADMMSNLPVEHHDVSPVQWHVNLFGDDGLRAPIMVVGADFHIPWWRRLLMRIVLGSKFRKGVQ